ncbi:MAG: tRNA (guanosine(46)-N7)-methyltransferase TrmB [Clostridiales bacterium]|nr:tRNA (guanosine(46)-N7)-methyltransferase TrmB [Clostridiales bacterium]
MRMRRKKWARPELAVCPYFVKDPSRHRGEWAAQFERKAPIHLELGCGKGTFAARLAADHPEINYMAIDIKSDILAVARRNVQQVFAQTGRPVDNLKLMAYEIQLIHTLMAPEDTVDRIYINFCNPWPRTAHHKKRLTHPKQLVLYATFLRDGGEIHFKTDDDELFRDSQEYLTQWGFDLRYVTYDLHESGWQGSPSTEHEEMFSAQGIKTKFLVAVYRKDYTDRRIAEMLRRFPKYAPPQVPDGVFRPEIV